MAKKEKIQKTNAMRELERAGVAYTVNTYEVAVEGDHELGVHIAEQLGEDPDQGFKTLVTTTPTGDHVVCCIPVAEELDLKAAALAAGEKSLTMMRVRELLAATGYVRGGCSPVGMKKKFPTLIDDSCLLYDEMFISGGKCGIQLKLAPQDLIAHTDAIVAPICRKG